jgi:raffinose/stachyose/melibiose transport system permease protein
MADLAHNPFGVPAEWHFDNFASLWKRGAFDDYFRTSVVIIIPVVLGSVILSVLSGYAFGRFHFWGSRVLFYMFLLGIMMPYQAMVISLYYNLSAIGLIDTYGALILPLIGLSVPFGTLWMWGFLQEVPQELIDASVIDGCTTWSTLWHVLLPLASPAMLALATLLFVWNWNEFLLALVLLPTNFTLPVGLSIFQGRQMADVTGLSAASTVTMVPSLIVYVLLQRHFIRGITTGAIQR